MAKVVDGEVTLYVKVRNFTRCGTIEGGASSLVASTMAWSSPLLTSKPVSIFRLSLSSTSALSITTNRNPVTIARAIWKATPNRNRSDSERCFREEPKRAVARRTDANLEWLERNIAGVSESCEMPIQVLGERSDPAA